MTRCVKGALQPQSSLRLEKYNFLLGEAVQKNR